MQKGQDAAVLLIDPKTSESLSLLAPPMFFFPPKNGGCPHMVATQLTHPCAHTILYRQHTQNTDALFAMCPVKEGSVDRCVDSSRYFVLKIQNAQGGWVGTYIIYLRGGGPPAFLLPLPCRFSPVSSHIDIQTCLSFLKHNREARLHRRGVQRAGGGLRLQRGPPGVREVRFAFLVPASVC